MTGMMWSNFWRVGTIKGTTINFVDTPAIGATSFLIPLYIFLVLVAISILTFQKLHRNETNRHAITKSVLSAFVVGILLFTLRMDYGWYNIWQLNMKGPLESLDPDAAADMRGLHLLAQEIKQKVPLTQTIKILSDYSYYDRMLLRYYLQPIKISDNPNYIILFNHKDMVFDSVQHVLFGKDRNIVENNLDFVTSYGDTFFLFKKKNTHAKQ